ncbi:MAG: M23 family metallopeptidase [Chitinophagales bacterium]
MKTILILFLCIQVTLAWSQSDAHNFPIEKGALTCPLTSDKGKIVSVYNGEVMSVVHHDRFSYAVIIKHGDYYSVYAGIDHTELIKGALVSTSQEIGNIASGNESKFNFELWKNVEKLDPKDWVACLN